MAEARPSTTAPLETPLEPLRWIGTYKILKGVLALLAGILLLRLMHRSLPDVALHWMEKLRIEPQSPLGHLILHRLLLIKNRSIGWIAVGLFAYIPLTCAEGIGLMLRKVWAEWLTVITTAALIPVELREVILRANAIRVSLLLINIGVLIYLIFRIRRDRYGRRPGFPVETALSNDPGLINPAPAVDSARSKAPPRPSRRSNVPG